MERCVIIDYGSGNLRSAAKAFERAARERAIDIEILVSGDPQIVETADRIVLPGVGAFADCRRGIDAMPGLFEVLTRLVRQEGRPFLGICVGMQLLADRGLEFSTTAGLGWIGGDVVAIEPGQDIAGQVVPLKVPHMGWNDLALIKPAHPLLRGIEAGEHGYFVHSYRFACADRADLLATVDYGGEIAAVIARDNIAGTQFHPEKSQATGQKLIGNFLGWQL